MTNIEYRVAEPKDRSDILDYLAKNRFIFPNVNEDNSLNSSTEDAQNLIYRCLANPVSIIAMSSDQIVGVLLNSIRTRSEDYKSGTEDGKILNCQLTDKCKNNFWVLLPFHVNCVIYMEIVSIDSHYQKELVVPTMMTIIKTLPMRNYDFNGIVCQTKSSGMHRLQNRMGFKLVREIKLDAQFGRRDINESSSSIVIYVNYYSFR